MKCTIPNPNKPLSIIVAIAQNYAIGRDNDLLWHISEDLKYFKKVTAGHTVIMGRKTYESLPFKPLPKRKNIIITNNQNYCFEGCEMVYSINEVLNYCDSDKENFIMGGGKIYEQFMPLVQKLYVTKIFKDFEADVFFPEIDCNVWKIDEQSEVYTDEKSNLQYAFFVYKRIE